MNKIYKNEWRSHDPQVWLLTVNTGDYIQWLYSKFIICMLTQINRVYTFGAQIVPYYVYLIRYNIVRYFVIM